RPRGSRARRELARDVIVDYHMHLRDDEGRLAHSVDTVERWVEAAAAAGVDEIGFTEHVYYFVETRPLWSIPYQVERCVYPLEPYVEAVLEVDYVPGREEETHALLEPYPWDYLLGSVHYVDGLAVDSTPSLVAETGP